MPTSAPTSAEERGLYDPRDEHDACGMGFIAHARGERSHTIVAQALDLLRNLSHRSAVGDDPRTGDGAGVLLQLPHAHLRRVCQPLGIALPEAGTYGVGMLFLAGDDDVRAASRRTVDEQVAAHGWRVLGWRDVPVDDSALGRRAREARPAIAQLFVAPGGVDREVSDASALERGLYVLRKRIERAFASADVCYVATLSSRTIVYKGMLRPDQLAGFYPDLADPELTSAIALVHSRFSTNTFPSWRLAHPYRFLCHNGEINTLRGNLTWMRVREEQLASERLGGAAELAPIVAPAQSDSASLDNALELLVQGGRPLTHAMSMLVPEAWMGDPAMSAERAAFYDYHAGLMEPWDGPAALAFTDGRQVGAALDRNGLRPARWLVTNDDLVVLASEAGALPIAPADVRAKGRLRPGQMILVNTVQGRVIYDEELRAELASLRPYRRWIAEQRVALGAVPDGAVAAPVDGAPLARLQRAYGYTREELALILAPMATAGEEPIGSMGTDTPLAVLSERPQLLFSYFKQLFAQVTNPPIDPIRERLVMSLRVLLGPQGNLLDEHPEHARQLALDGPVLTARAMAALRAVAEPSLRPTTISAHFAATGEPGALAAGLETLCAAAAGAARAGHGIIVLSDRFPSRHWAPIPSLLAVSAVHHHLIREGLRSRVGLVVESGEAREVSHFALLAAYGASAVHPWLALDTVGALARGDSHDPDAAQGKYVKAVEKGLLKILSKMGISTLQSYCGAQLFEAVGLARGLAARHFTGTVSRIGGIGLDEIAAESLARHAVGFADGDALLEAGGEYHHRARGEEHAWGPMTIATLQRATRDGSFATFREFSRLADASASRGTIRGMLDFAPCDPVPLEEVEPAASIARRFVTGAMSFGSISREAHETIAVAMNTIGGRSNTGEGGEDPARFGTDRNSAIKQVASARFGVTTEYLVNAAELQIKIAQGAKPGEGGQLPGHKVDAVIARTRHSTAGVTLISPPPHHDIYSIEDLKQLIFDLKNVSPSATVSVKLVAEAGVGTVAAGVAKAHADLIVISGDSGGTGASPLSSIKRAGAPWELGLAEAQQTLVANGLRGRVRLQTDGQLKTGRDVVIAALLGAEEFGFATAPLIVEGCVMMRKCHLNTCPVGIATQDPVLRAKFAGTPEQLVRYFMFVAEEVRELMARLGFRTVDEMVGRSEVLRQRGDGVHGKAATLDLAALLHAARPRDDRDSARRCVASQEHGLDAVLDHRLIRDARPALELGEKVTIRVPVTNVDRSVGTMLSGEIARRHGRDGLADDSIVVRCTGSAGQSFGAFGARGLTLELEGEANDYVAKGLSGARVIVRPPRGARFLPDETVIVGNTVLYGATSGEAYFGGVAGERFAVRNSGAVAVVEGVGDHGCEYMTGGVVIVLGRTGRNFAAGMSGGVAYVLDESAERALEARCNRELVELEPVTASADRALLRHHVEAHARLTGSPRARHLLGRWDEALRHFVRVMPVEYRRALEKQSGQAGVGGGRMEGALYG